MSAPQQTSVTESPEADLALYETMLLIREVETRIESLHYSGEMHGSFHSSMGQEAAAVGVISCLRPTDLVTSTHRGHGHAIAKGMDVVAILAELLGLEQGSSGGKGGSMHLHGTGCGFLGENAIVAGGAPWAAGAAWAARRQGRDVVGVSFGGDGAAAQGVLAETLRMARTWGAPVLLVCENNHLAHSMPAARTFGEPGSIAAWAGGFGIRSEFVAGDDVMAVRDLADDLIGEVRATGRAAFIEVEVWRVRAHSLNDPDYRYLPKGLGESYLESHDPLVNAERRLGLSDDEIAASREKITEQVDAAVSVAMQGHAAPVRDATTGVYSTDFEGEATRRGW